MEHASTELSGIKPCLDLVNLVIERTNQPMAVIVHQLAITYDNTMRLLSSEPSLVGAMEGMHEQLFQLLTVVGCAIESDPAIVASVFGIFIAMQKKTDEVVQKFVSGLMDAGATIEDAKRAISGPQFTSFANSNLDLSELFEAAKEL